MTGPWPFVRMTGDGKTGGKRWAYFRSKETGSIPLGDPDSSDFLRRLADARDLHDRLKSGGQVDRTDPTSLAALIDLYLASAEYRALADPTQLDYARTCDVLKAELGDQPFRFITRSMLKAVRDDYADQARKANKLQQMTSRIYSWANEADLVPDGVNPAVGLKRLRRKGGEREIVPWSDEEIAWVLAVAPAHVQTPVLIALYTGQRREDVMTMTWQQVQGDFVRVRQSKTRALLDIACHPVLRAHLDQLRVSAKIVSLTGPICLTATGKPFATADALSGAIRRVVEALPQVPNNRSMHGLRYAAAARMEEGGATVAAIEAVLGHRTFKMALKYAGARLRGREGVAAMKGTNDG